MSQYIDMLRDVNLLSLCVRLVLAVLCSGALGLERGQKKRAAGFRTHMLVCIGATLVMVTNQYIYKNYGGDPARLGAQVISGIGFLGAGTIIVTGTQQVKGLTTAAGLWAAACMGLALGVGYYEAALLGSVFIWFIASTLHSLDENLMAKSKVIDVYVEFEGPHDLSHFIAVMKKEGTRVSGIEQIKGSGTGQRSVGALISLRAEKRNLQDTVFEKVLSMPGVTYAELI